MQLHIRHETRLSLRTPGQAQRAEPAPDAAHRAGQRVLAWTIAAPGRQVQQVDAHGNLMHLLTLDKPHDEIRIVVGGAVETSDPPSGLLSDDGRLSPLAYVPETTLDAGRSGVAALRARPRAARP